jgi:hypothetical protein
MVSSIDPAITKKIIDALEKDKNKIKNNDPMKETTKP